MIQDQAVTLPDPPPLWSGERHSFDGRWHLIVLVHRYDEPDRWGMHILWPVIKDGGPPKVGDLKDTLRYLEEFTNPEISRWAHSTVGLFPAKPEPRFYKNPTEDGEEVRPVQIDWRGMADSLRYAITHSCAPIEWHSALDANKPEAWSRVEVWG